MTTTLEFLISAKEEASQAFEKVSKSVDKTTKRMDALKVGVSIASGVIVAAVSQFAQKAVDGASDLVEAQGAVNEVFGAAADKIEKFSETSAENLGNSQTATLEAAKSFGVYGQAAGLADDANAKFSMNLIKTATDLASFHNTSPEQAIQALTAGLRGESEPLRKFGILLDYNTIKAKAMSMGIYDGNGVLSQQQKVLAANAVIMDQVGAAQGDWNRTSGDLANRQRVFDATLQDLNDTIGEALLPVFQKILDIAQPILTWLKENPAVIKAVAIAVGVLTVALVALNVVMWAMSINPIALVIMAIVVAVAALIVAIVFLITHWKEVWKWFTDSAKNAAAWVKGVFNGFAIWWGSLWTSIGNWIQNVWNGFVHWVKMVALGFYQFVRGVFNGFMSWWNSFWSSIGSFIQHIWQNWIVNPIKTAVNWIKAFISNGLAVIKMGWNAAWNGLGQIVRNVFNGVMGWIEGGVNGAIDLINGLINTINLIPGVDVSTIGHVGLPRMAEGGDVTRAGYAMVGERGAEIVRLPTGSRVYPHGTGPGGGGGGGISAEQMQAWVDQLAEAFEKGTHRVSVGALETAFGG